MRYLVVIKNIKNNTDICCVTKLSTYIVVCSGLLKSTFPGKQDSTDETCTTHEMGHQIGIIPNPAKQHKLGK